MHEVAAMPEQMLKISTNLYDTLMPLVKEQVRAQIKVADLSRANIQIQPADFQNWSQAAERLVAEGYGPIEKKKNEEIAALRSSSSEGDDLSEQISAINAKCEQARKDHESRVLHQPVSFFVELGTTYNFL